MTADNRERDHASHARTTRRALRGALVALALPSLLLAQAPTGDRPATHQVREGDTLWDIARQYLGDPFLWPEIYRINTDVVEDPHWIYPGEILRLPGGAPVPVATTETGEVVAGDEAIAVSTGPTTFSQRRGSVAGGSGPVRSVVGRVPAASVNRGEILSAPWVDREGGPREFGRLVETTAQSIVIAAENRTRLSPQDRVFIFAPRNVAPERGERFLVVERGPVIDYVGQIMIPTGIVEVEVARAGEASTARIVQNFGEIKMGQLLLPMTAVPTLEGSAQATAVETGPQARVIWIYGDVRLPSLQRYVMLDATERDGVKLGDQFTFMRRAQRLEGGARLPAEDIAVAQVVRVTPYGTTAMIIGQRHGAINEGTHARVTARLP